MEGRGRLSIIILVKIKINVQCTYHLKFDFEKTFHREEGAQPSNRPPEKFENIWLLRIPIHVSNIFAVFNVFMFNNKIILSRLRLYINCVLNILVVASFAMFYIILFYRLVIVKIFMRFISFQWRTRRGWWEWCTPPPMFLYFF